MTESRYQYIHRVLMNMQCQKCKGEGCDRDGTIECLICSWTGIKFTREPTEVFLKEMSIIQEIGTKTSIYSAITSILGLYKCKHCVHEANKEKGQGICVFCRDTGLRWKLNIENKILCISNMK